MKLADHTQRAPTRRTAERSGARAINTDRLDSMLGKLEDEHLTLLELAKAHKEALSHASIPELNEITMKTSEVLMRIAQIEDARRAMIEQDFGSLASLDQLMEHFNTQDQDRIGQRKTRLRELIGRVKEEQAAVQVASENLASHMKGLIKQVSASLSHAGTYSRVGSVSPSHTQVVSSLDLVQ